MTNSELSLLIDVVTITPNFSSKLVSMPLTFSYIFGLHTPFLTGSKMTAYLIGNIWLPISYE